jgi:putative cell wall-binding protein
LELLVKRRRLHLALACATALTVGAAAAVVSLSGASASPPGTLVGLTTTNGTKTIAWQNGHTLTLGTTVTDGTWAPDGSRLAFVSGDNAIESVRFDNAADTTTYAPADGTPKSHPSWILSAGLYDGGFPIWSAHVTDPQTNAGSDVLQYAMSPGGSVHTIALAPTINWTHPDAGPQDIVVQGQHGTDAPGIYWLSAFELQLAPEHATLLVQDGSSPAASPTSNQAAFLRDDAAGHAQVWVITLTDATSGVQVTSDPVDHSNVTWSPDGTTLAFNEGNAVYTVKADGSQATALVPVTVSAGAPAYEVGNPSTLLRAAGKNRYQTAAAISQNSYADRSDFESLINAQSVVLTRGDTFADALSASVLATAKQGPLLMTPPTSLNADTVKEINRVLFPHTGAIVYLVGGTSAISTAVENQIKAMGFVTKRLSGANRYATAVAVDQAITSSPSMVFAATGAEFPDALSAGAAAGSLGSPGVVVLTDGNAMPAETKAYIDGLNVTDSPPALIGVGGSGAAALESANYTNGIAIVGQDRYDTAVRVAKFFFSGSSIDFANGPASCFGVAVGTNWPDAMAGSAMLGLFHCPLLLTPSTTPNSQVRAYLVANSPGYGKEIVFGQSDVVSNSVAAAYLTSISGPTGTQTFNGAPLRRQASGASVVNPAHLTNDLPSYVTPLS